MKTKKILISLLVLIVVIGGFFFYRKSIAPTKVAIINYPDFMLTKMAKSNDNNWVSIKTYTPDKLPNLNSYDQILIFGMGIELPASEEEKIAQARDNGVNVFIQALTNPRLEHLANMHGKTFDIITDYMNYGGAANYKNMFNYIRREIDGKTLFTDTITAPQAMPDEAIFYKEEEAIFEKLSDFDAYAKKNNLHKSNAPKIIIFTSMPGPFNANREHLNDLIGEYERRGFNVYPIAAFNGRGKYMEQIKPDLVVYLPHGRLGRGDQMIQWLKQLNVPVLCPITVFQQHEKWLKDKQGLVGGILSQSVTMPEIDGGILPYAVFAQYEDKNGYLLFRAIPDRLTKFGEITEKYLNLKKKPNKDKKIAIVYFKGPGKNALVASNMEVLPSLHNTLLRLQKEGYNLGNLPHDYTQFEKDINQRGPILGAYALGAFDKFLKNGNPELISATDYNQWSKEILPQELIQDVEKTYGKAPGSYMAVTKKSKDYIAIARVQYGNVVLLPQPLPAVGENEYQLVHGANIAPPHSYIAPYLWIQKGFKADATIHFGTHGSLEFLPGKQIALSSYDWTDPLIGTAPHFYIYTISNVGEGMIAKRRSYAVTQTYLTPPFIEAQALGEQEELHQKIHKYEQLQGALKREYALSIKKTAVEQKIHKDLGLDSIITEPYNEEDMMKLANYLEEIDHEKITGGLYTMGIPYTIEKADETVLMMMVNSLSYNLAEIDIQKGIYPRKKTDNKLFFNKKYTHPAEGYIKSIIRGASPTSVFQKIVSQKDIERANKWKEKTAKNSQINYAMFAKQADSYNDSIVTQAEKDELKKCIIQIIPQKEKLNYIKRIESDKEYQQMLSLLDPKTRQKVKKISKMIPAMAAALKISEDQTVNTIIKLIQAPELRTLALTYINDKNLTADVEREEQRQDSILISNALQPENFSIIVQSQQPITQINYQEIEEHKRQLDYFSQNKEKLNNILGKKQNQAKELQLLTFLQNEFENYKQKANTQINKLETQEMIFSQAVFQVQNDLNDITRKKKELLHSPEQEFETLINSLNKGYTAPTSGGDPITNPSTIPTGRNLYAIDTEKTPSKEAWNVAKKLGNSLLEDFQSKNDGKYPEKISFTLWSGSFIETEGTTIAQIFYFLGVEPVWDNFGRVNDIRIIPMSELKRPRIDVVVQTSGQLRDLAASRLFLINKAIAKVAIENDKDQNNFVAKGVADAEAALIKKGFSPKRARELATKRVFGGVNGNYGTGIMGLVESSDRWDSTQVVAERYINNMGAVYGDQENWGEFEAGVFEAALLNTQAVVQPRQSNTWGALSLDHVYEFMGGLNLAIRHVTGNDAESYFNDFRNASNPRIQGLKEAIWVESRTTLLNPRYINELTKGGASAAETFAETFRNTFGWNVMKPSVIENRLWDELYSVYVEDKLDLKLHEFFERENPYALQEMTAVMLETVRKGMWKATPEQVKKMSDLHAKMVNEHQAGCSGFVCDNTKLKDFISKQLPSELKEKYQTQIEQIREVPQKEGKEEVVLKKDEKNNIKSQNQTPSFLQNKTVWLSISIALLLVIVVAIALRKKRKK